MAILTQMPSYLLNELYVSAHTQGAFAKYTYSNDAIIAQSDLVLGPSGNDEYFADRFVHGVGPDIADGNLVVAPYADAVKTNFDTERSEGRVDRVRIYTSIDRQAFDRQDPSGQSALLESTILDNLAHKVHSQHERTLAKILKGDGNPAYSRELSTITLDNAERFNVAGSEVIATLVAAQNTYGGDVLVLSQDVAIALAKHADFKGSDSAPLNFEALKLALQGYNFNEVHILNLMATESGPKQGMRRVQLFNSTVAIFSRGAIENKRVMPMSMEMNSVLKSDTYDIFASDASSLFVKSPDDAVAFKNVLAP